MTDADSIREIAARGDAVEWLRILNHESVRANNAEERIQSLEARLRTLEDAVQNFISAGSSARTPEYARMVNALAAAETPGERLRWYDERRGCYMPMAEEKP